MNPQCEPCINSQRDMFCDIGRNQNAWGGGCIFHLGIKDRKTKKVIMSIDDVGRVCDCFYQDYDGYYRCIHPDNTATECQDTECPFGFPASKEDIEEIEDDYNPEDYKMYSPGEGVDDCMVVFPMRIRRWRYRQDNKINKFQLWSLINLMESLL